MKFFGCCNISRTFGFTIPLSTGRQPKTRDRPSAPHYSELKKPKTERQALWKIQKFRFSHNALRFAGHQIELDFYLEHGTLSGAVPEAWRTIELSNQLPHRACVKSTITIKQ